ncbi:helix-turn-helix domain-containing protein [Methylosinus sp. H3A]|uniref:helix-turn-helix domain-containing protein n=1 Tax=Methylosinus sp. H3A TaxID=2785786 RepID=UPI0018C1FA7F|nr:helix-turn-helix domain-containing protein [Methylosinus sp. H3A]MBG0811874.1 helix-turn-helix domain-containing protein [Methylosinus sp. H3A]
MPRRPSRPDRSKKAVASISRLVETPATKIGRVPVSEVEDIVRRMLATQRYSPWLDTEEAAHYLRKEPGTLKGWRSKGEGPRFHVVNDKFIRYHVDDLDAYVRAAGQAPSPVEAPCDGGEKR